MGDVWRASKIDWFLVTHIFQQIHENKFPVIPQGGGLSIRKLLLLQL